MTDAKARSVSAGGSATINGVLYQMLWSLLQASRARFVDTPTVQGGEITKVTIVLEPIGGGGDLVVQTEHRRSVEQLKARPDGGTWSLREVIESVIPDLYLAANDDESDVDYRFVTEGKMGKWHDVYKFFHSLKNRPCTDDPLSDLDDSSALKLSKRKAKQTSQTTEEQFWNLDQYTERTLFKKVVEEVRKRKTVRNGETEQTTQKRLRHVLGHFEFVGGQDMLLLQRELDARLMTVIDRNDELPRIRDSLAMELARRATAGNADFHCDAFFRDQGLNAIPLSDWGALRRASARVAQQALERLGYDRTADVRVCAASAMLNEWSPTTPMLAISGESGCGKSWRAYATCDLEQSGRSISVVINAGDTLDATLARAASEVWQIIAGHDEFIPLPQIGRRVRQVVGNVTMPWLTLVIDGHVEFKRAAELAQQNWEEWGVRVLITTSPDIARRIDVTSKGRCGVIILGDFTDSELHAYLESFLGDSWPTVPGFVRNPLRRPLFASLYRRIVERLPDPVWSPTSEYDLFKALWQQIDNPTDETCIIRLADRFLDAEQSTWTITDMLDAGGSQDTASRLERCGWLRRADTTPLPEYEFTHLRLLNWACALAMLARHKKPNADHATLHATLRSLLWGEAERHGHRLRFTTMDFLCLACDDKTTRVHIPDCLSALSHSYRNSEVLYKELLPTLGETILDALAVRLRADIDNSLATSLNTGCIGRIGGSKAVDIAHSLLKENDPLLRLAATHILISSPSADAIVLDGLWSLHNESKSDPNRFLREREESHRHLLYGKTFGALRECCRLAPEWLGERIDKAEPDNESVGDLAYLLANVAREQGRQLWQRHKHTLFQKTKPNSRRSLAICIDVFTDRDELPWLIDNAGVREDLLGAAALRALVRLDPIIAVEQLDRLDQRELSLTRSWFFDHLFAIALEQTQDKLRKMMEVAADVWGIAGVYDGRCHLMDLETLTLLLKRLERELDVTLSTTDSPLQDAQLFVPLRLLVQTNTRKQLLHLANECGGPLEAKLVEYVLRIGPRRGRSCDSLTRSEAIELLFRINGEGFSKAVNCVLRAESRYGRSDGYEFAAMCPNAETNRILADICDSNETLDGHYIDQCDAALVLAESNVWEPVVALIRRIGLEALRDVTKLPEHGRRPPPHLVSEIRDLVLSEPGAASVGDVLILGFGPPDYSQVIAAVSRECRYDGELAHACVIALELLENHDADNVPFLRGQLDVPKHKFSATNALIVNGTQSALEALSDHAGDRVGDAVALNLVTRLTEPMEAIERVRNNIVRSIGDGRSFDLASEIFGIVEGVQDDKVAVEILSDAVIEDYLRNEAFIDEGKGWCTGSKVSAIRCLAILDRHAAVIATKAALRHPKARDRNHYPSLLVDLDGASAFGVLMDLLETEKSDSFRAAIGRALSTVECAEATIANLRSTNADRRQAACFVSHWQKDVTAIRQVLQECLNDEEEAVSRAASAALVQLSICTEAESLGEAIMNARTSAERWLLLDCLVSLADPGDEYHEWPIHGPELGTVLTTLQTRYAIKRLKERRKKEDK